VDSPQNLNLDASQTKQIREGQIFHAQIYINILPFIAALGKIPTWD